MCRAGQFTRRAARQVFRYSTKKRITSWNASSTNRATPPCSRVRSRKAGRCCAMTRCSTVCCGSRRSYEELIERLVVALCAGTGAERGIRPATQPACRWLLQESRAFAASTAAVERPPAGGRRRATCFSAVPGGVVGVPDVVRAQWVALHLQRRRGSEPWFTSAETVTALRGLSAELRPGSM